MPTFEFWQERKHKFPAFFTLSAHTLCALASSATLEKIFSASMLIMQPLRARLFSEKLEILVYVFIMQLQIFGK